MQEDEIGTLSTIVGHDYVSCSRCGAVIPRASAYAVAGDASQSHSDYEYLCGPCRSELANGEQELPVTAE